MVRWLVTPVVNEIRSVPPSIDGVSDSTDGNAAMISKTTRRFRVAN